MFIERYWRIAVAALPVGFALGAGLFGLFTISGNPEWRAYLSAEEVLRSTGAYGAIGAIVALCSLAGGGAAIALLDRRLSHRPARRILAASVGAGVAVVAVGAAVSAIDGREPAFFYLGLLLAVPAGIAAAALVGVAERRTATTLPMPMSVTPHTY
jgi:Kef-type K+ transport system membrane component KefB